MGSLSKMNFRIISIITLVSISLAAPTSKKEKNQNEEKENAISEKQFFEKTVKEICKSCIFHKKSHKRDSLWFLMPSSDGIDFKKLDELKNRNKWINGKASVP